MYNLIRKIVPTFLKDFYFKQRYHSYFDEITQSINNNSNRIFILGVPEHGNLGDQAIAKAQIEFLNETLPSHTIIEIPFKMVYFFNKELHGIIKAEDLIVVMGGGYMGNIWPEAEDFIRFVITEYPDNKIVVFPQTVYYEDSEESIDYLEESLEIYNSHANLTLTAREKRSFDFLNNYYPNVNNILTPDIVLYLNLKQNKSISEKNNSVLFCMRKDIEKVSRLNGLSGIEKYCKVNNLNYDYTDTVINRPVFINQRDNLIKDKLDEFNKYDLIVTDRLHAMIFATILGKPCIAINNKTDKVRGVYQWIKDYNYIHLLTNNSNINEVMDYLLSINEIDDHDLRDKFNDLKNSLNYY